jgi:hypothetical protein
MFGNTKAKAEAWVQSQVQDQSNRIITAIYTAVAVMVFLILAVVTHAR